MRCYSCDTDENWHKLEGYHSKSLIVVCKECGNLCHYIDDKRREEILGYYRRQYRPHAPGHFEILTKNNKINYIRKWLMPFMAGKKDLLCGDIGAANGYVLNFLKQHGHRVRGSEWDVIRRRFSEHYYGIPLEEEISRKEPYDLLIMVHTLEHILEPDKKLSDYASLLKPEGRMLVSTPYWLDVLEEQSGTPMQAFDNLFHKDHVNLFSQNQLQNLFRKAGLVAEFCDFTTYGQTYIVWKGGATGIVKDDWKKVSDAVTKQKVAMQLYHEKKYKKAIDVWPDFPEAHISLIFGTYGKDPGRQEDMIASLPEKVRGNHRLMWAVAHFLTQYDKLPEADQAWSKAYDIRPHAVPLMERGKILCRLGRHLDALPLFSAVGAWDPRMWPEAQDWMGKAACAVPTWDERARSEAKEALFKKADDAGAVKIELEHDNGHSPKGQAGPESDVGEPAKDEAVLAVPGGGNTVPQVRL